MRFLHSVRVQENTPAADGVVVDDLAVNPLSVVLVNLAPLNDTGTLSDFQLYMGICAAVNRVAITFNGVSVVSMRGEDAAALAFFRHNCVPLLGNKDSTNNERRSVVLPIFLGRRAYDPNSCFPAARRGELQLELDLDIADTGYDGLNYSVETIEILGASPKEFERTTQLAVTNSAGGITDYDLPVGNICRGVLLWGTTGHAGASPAPSWGRISTLVDSEQMCFASTDFEVSRALTRLRGGQPMVWNNHIHAENDTGGPTDPMHVATDPLDNYTFLDFDPTKDDAFSLDLRKATRFQVQANIETADAVRLVTVEALPVSFLAGIKA